MGHLWVPEHIWKSLVFRKYRGEKQLEVYVSVSGGYLLMRCSYLNFRAISFSVKA